MKQLLLQQTAQGLLSFKFHCSYTVLTRVDTLAQKKAHLKEKSTSSFFLLHFCVYEENIYLLSLTVSLSSHITTNSGILCPFHFSN